MKNNLEFVNDYHSFDVREIESLFNEAEYAKNISDIKFNKMEHFHNKLFRRLFPEKGEFESKKMYEEKKKKLWYKVWEKKSPEWRIFKEDENNKIDKATQALAIFNKELNKLKRIKSKYYKVKYDAEKENVIIHIRNKQKYTIVSIFEAEFDFYLIGKIPIHNAEEVITKLRLNNDCYLAGKFRGSPDFRTIMKSQALDFHIHNISEKEIFPLELKNKYV